MIKRCEVVVYRSYTFDTDVFNKMVLDAYNNAIILTYDFQKIWIMGGFAGKKTKGIPFVRKTTKGGFLNPYIEVLIGFLNQLLCCAVIMTIFIKFRPKVAYIEASLFVPVFSGLLRRLGLCNKSIYGCGDWWADRVDRIWLPYHIFLNNVFPFLDRLACRLNDEVINVVSQIEDARYNHWGRNITHSQKTFRFSKPQLLVEKSSLEGVHTNIFFLGATRSDSGFDLAFHALKEIRKRIDSKIIIVGPEPTYKATKRLACEMGVKEYVDFMGFVKTEDLPELTKNCFCALNTYTTQVSHSSYTIPGKFIHYLQLALPIITTNSSGFFSQVVIEKSLGIVMNYNFKDKELVEAMNDIYCKQSLYRNHIVEYINSIPDIDIKSLFEAK